MRPSMNARSERPIGATSAIDGAMVMRSAATAPSWSGWGSISRRDHAAQTDREDVDLSQLYSSTALRCTAGAGSAVLFHSNIVHGSGSDYSDRPGTPRCVPTSRRRRATRRPSAPLPAGRTPS